MKKQKSPETITETSKIPSKESFFASRLENIYGPPDILPEFESRYEEKLYNEFKSFNIYPRSQYPISQMHVDFAFHKHHLVVEVDGEHHGTDIPQIRSDERRLAYLLKNGWDVIRITNSEVYERSFSCAIDIIDFLKGRCDGLTVTKKHQGDLVYYGRS